MKENNGHRAFQQKVARFARMFLLTMVLCFFVHSLYFSSSDDHRGLVQRQSPVASRETSTDDESIQQLGHSSSSSSSSSSSRDWSQEDLVGLDLILSASVHLIDIQVEESKLGEFDNDHTYAGVYGTFCELDFSLQKQDPSSVPMFQDLVAQSSGCREKRWHFDLREVATLARARDADKGTKQSLVPKLLDLSAVVFHESRCGSTLVANSFVGVNPSKHRVYSESAPVFEALDIFCSQQDYSFLPPARRSLRSQQSSSEVCSRPKQAGLVLHDVITLMSRSNDPKEMRVLFKFQSKLTSYLPVFLQAFPNTPWLFVFREPVQVLASYFRGTMENAAWGCIRTQDNPPYAVQQIAKRRGVNDASTLSSEDYCAAHLASLTEAAVYGLQSSSLGIAVDYKGLPTDLREIFSRRLGIPMGAAEINNLNQMSYHYSKGRPGQARAWKEDSQIKQHKATDQLREAAQTFLQDSYQRLSSF